MRADCPKGKLESFKFFSIPGIAITVKRQEISGCFPFVRTDRPDHSIKTIHLDQSNKKIVCRKEMVFQQKVLEKPISLSKWMASQFWLLESTLSKSETTTHTKHSLPELISFIISSVWANWKSTVCSTCCSLPAENEYIYGKLIKCQDYHFHAKLSTYKQHDPLWTTQLV